MKKKKNLPLLENIEITGIAAEGKALTQVAEYIGIDPADLLAGICINATRRANRAQQTAQAPPAANQQTAASTRKPAPTAGLFNI